MNVKQVFFLVLAGMVIPSGVSVATHRPAKPITGDINAHYEDVLQKYTPHTPAKPKTLWQKFTKNLAKAMDWMTWERILGISGTILIGYCVKRQFFDKPSHGGNGGGNGRKALSFREGYAAQLAAPVQNARTQELEKPRIIQGPNGKQIIIQQIVVVPQHGPSCPYHASVNADLIAAAEANEKNREQLLGQLKDPQIVGQRVEQYAEHIEKIINGEIPAAHEGNRILAGDGTLKRDTQSSGWAEQPVPLELLAQNPGNAQVVSYDDGIANFNEEAFRQPGIHRGVIIARDARDRDGNGHYYTIVRKEINPQLVRYTICDSMNNRSRVLDRMINRFITNVEWNLGDPVQNFVYAPLNRAILNPAAEIHEKYRKADAGNPRPASAAGGD